MIELTRTHEGNSAWNVKVLGVGGAGSHAADRLTKDAISGVEILVANTDFRALSASVTQERIVLGQRLTRGLGTGGDPDLGRSAAVESMGQVTARLQGASLVILLVGLGGGTGSGAAPCIAEAARQLGAHVAVFATLPFSFEGRRRSEQAHEGLDALRRHANLVVCFENDRMAAVADPASGIEDAFESVDSLLAQAVRAVATMTGKKNVMHSGLDEIAATVAEYRATALFGHGLATGEERARAALARAFSNPLFDSEGALASATRLWVYVSGGSDLRWSEVQVLMQELTERISSEVRVFFGAAVDPEQAGSVSVTLLAGIPDGVGVGARPAVLDSKVETTVYPIAIEARAVSHADESSQRSSRDREHTTDNLGASEAHAEELAPVTSREQKPASEIAVNPNVNATEPLVSSSAESQEMDHLPLAEQVSAPQRSVPIPPYEAAKGRRESAAQNAQRVEAIEEPVFLEPVTEKAETNLAPTVVADKEADRRGVAETHAEVEPHTQPEVAPLSAAAKRAKDTVQEQMRFESPNRGGRFEKTDPTIVDGEDLDVPTFLRQHLPLE
jgi:cell division protein FtsZ